MPCLDFANKEFLQAIMSYGIMNARQVKDVINDIMRRHGVQSDFASYMTSVVAAINTSLEPYDMQIKKCICEVKGTNYYALVNQTEHPLNKLSPLYTPMQLELFKKIVEEVLTSDSGTVTSMEALNFEFGETVKFSRREREETLTRMANDMWLVEERGEISLSARSIYELDVYIREVYKDQAVICPACNALVVRGQRCEKGNCSVRIHNHCAKKLFKAGTQRKCPSCKTAWSVPLSEENSTQSQNPGTTKEGNEAASSANQPTTSGRRARHPSRNS